SEGKKMGKTQSGALWLDPEKTSPYDFYQYWVNVDDADVIKCLKLLTFLPLEEIEKMAEYKDAEINKAKRVLAYEVTKLVHGEEEANKVKAAAEAVFGGGMNSADMPTTEIEKAELTDGMSILDILVKASLASSKGEARRLVQQGGVSLNGEKVTDIAFMLTDANFENNEATIKKGKKVFHRIVLK
ncbi:MAG: tyrosine--tRNA ligase, partial [Clostridia bacterium]|nr:tyrosine--tRNA ligase [Clostridia bacterium]